MFLFFRKIRVYTLNQRKPLPSCNGLRKETLVWTGKVIFILWSVLGILDLVDAIVLGTVIQAGLLRTAIDTSAMSQFGMSLITVYLVPISILLHFIGLSQLRKGSNMS